MGDVRDGEAWLVGAHISGYDQAGYANHDPDRDRKLFLRAKEIDSLYGKVKEKGLTLCRRGSISRTAGRRSSSHVAKGKDVRDKRRDLARRDADRQIERALKSHR